MNTTDRILGESTSQAFDDLIKLSLSLRDGDYSREGILERVREYEIKYGLSDELRSVFVGIIDAIDDYDGDGYSQHEYFGELFYTIVYLVQTGKIYTGGLLNQILRGDPFGSNIDLSMPTAESKPYIDAIANTFDRRATEVMATAEYIVSE
jgi:hypothetical protein